MPENTRNENEWHRTFATSLFNLTWDLLDKPDRTPEEDAKMVHAAHASRYHWGEIGTAVEVERGEWQISRVYAVLERPIAALAHARRCLAICTENEIGDFDIAFAYEAVARAYAVAGDTEQSRAYVDLSTKAALNISDPDNKSYFLSELDAVKRMLT